MCLQERLPQIPPVEEHADDAAWRPDPQTDGGRGVTDPWLPPEYGRDELPGHADPRREAEPRERHDVRPPQGHRRACAPPPPTAGHRFAPGARRAAPVRPIGVRSGPTTPGKFREVCRPGWERPAERGRGPDSTAKNRGPGCRSRPCVDRCSVSASRTAATRARGPRSGRKPKTRFRRARSTAARGPPP